MNQFALLSVFILGFVSCGSGEESASPVFISGMSGNSHSAEVEVKVGDYKYGFSSMAPVLGQEVQINKDEKAFMIQGEVEIKSRDYCNIELKVAIQANPSASWKIMREFRFRAVEGSNSVSRPSVSFALPAGGKFKIYDLVIQKSEGYPDAPCTEENVSIRTFSAFRTH